MNQNAITEILINRTNTDGSKPKNEIYRDTYKIVRTILTQILARITPSQIVKMMDTYTKASRAHTVSEADNCQFLGLRHCHEAPIALIEGCNLSFEVRNEGLGSWWELWYDFSVEPCVAVLLDGPVIA